MSLSILSATIRNNGVISRIDISDMTKELYQKCKEFLFCPNEDCNARIEFASGSKLTYFRTKRSKVEGEEIIEQHIPDCVYSVEHDKELGIRGRFDPSILVGITDKHMDDVLKRAYKKYKDPSYGKKGENSTEGSKSKSRQSRRDDSLFTRGRASFTTAIDEEVKQDRQPPLFQRNINDITEQDYGQIRTVNGLMEGFATSGNYKYITLRVSDGRKGRILFGELFQVNNSPQHSQLDIYKVYFDHQKNKGNEVFVACLGEVTRDDFDISVVMHTYKGINLDGKSHYEILRLFS